MYGYRYDSKCYWWMTQGVRRGHKAAFSTLRREPVLSMAFIGRIGEIPLGVGVPYTIAERVSGHVVVPEEFRLLQGALPDADLVYLNDLGYHASIQGAIQVRHKLLGVRVGHIEGIYGLVSGFVGVVFFGTDAVKCNVPKGFGVQDFVNLVYADFSAWQKFLLRHGEMNKVKRQKVEAGDL